MKIIYRAHDGKEFNNALECANYEASHPIYEMWDRHGKTDDFDSALLVDIKGEVEIYINECKERGITTDGIHQKGLYFWSSERFEWVLIDEHTQWALFYFLTK